MRSKRNPPLAAAAPSEAGALSERLRSDLERLGLASTRVKTVSQQLEPMLASLSSEQYGAVLAGVAACTTPRDGTGASADPPFDVSDVERLMQGVREEVQKLDEGLRMLSAYVSGLRKHSSQRQSNDTLH